jgi:hypothetical protein
VDMLSILISDSDIHMFCVRFDDKWCIYPMDTIKQQCPQKVNI